MQEKAAKWHSFGGQMDGLTTNGVLVMRPKGEFSSTSEPGVWREISVCGNVHTLRATRAAQSKGQQVRYHTNTHTYIYTHCPLLELQSQYRCAGDQILFFSSLHLAYSHFLFVPTISPFQPLSLSSSSFLSLQVRDESQILVDGSLIDLCGVTLLWRAAAALPCAPGPEHLEQLRVKLNAARPHCPVLLHTLAFPSLDDSESHQPRQPWAYLCCGHVHGFHPWRGRGTSIKHEEEKEENDKDVMKGAREGDKERECPLCRARGLYVALTLGRESRLCVDAGPPSHAFVPCGHVCSEATAVYWSKTLLPCGASSFYPACPFCMKQLAHDRPYVKLIFQGAPD